MELFVTACICTAILSISLLIQSSTKNSATAAISSKDTWTIIQEKILTTTCATGGCHASNSDATFSQHNLILAPAVAYENLINAVPKNAAAIAAGLVRVKAGDYTSSLLYHKINCQSGQYGATMPLGGPNLTQGQIEFIKQWITNGAPKTGSVVDESVLANTTVCSQTFVPLAPPAAGEGFQLAINPFTVNPNTEREVFVTGLHPILLLFM